MFAQRRHRHRRQWYHAILAAFAGSHQYQPALQIEILHAQAQRLQQAQAATILQQGDQSRYADDVAEELRHLLTRQHRRQPL